MAFRWGGRLRTGPLSRSQSSREGTPLRDASLSRLRRLVDLVLDDVPVPYELEHELEEIARRLERTHGKCPCPKCRDLPEKPPWWVP